MSFTIDPAEFERFMREEKPTQRRFTNMFIKYFDPPQDFIVKLQAESTDIGKANLIRSHFV